MARKPKLFSVTAKIEDEEDYGIVQEIIERGDGSREDYEHQNFLVEMLSLSVEYGTPIGNMATIGSTGPETPSAG